MFQLGDPIKVPPQTGAFTFMCVFFNWRILPGSRLYSCRVEICLLYWRFWFDATGNCPATWSAIAWHKAIKALHPQGEQTSTISVIRSNRGDQWTGILTKFVIRYTVSDILDIENSQISQAFECVLPTFHGPWDSWMQEPIFVKADIMLICWFDMAKIG